MTPHRCPICNGTGTVPWWFYGDGEPTTGTSMAQVQCHACGGTGVLWSQPTPPEPWKIVYDSADNGDPWPVPHDDPQICTWVSDTSQVEPGAEYDRSPHFV